MADKAEDSGAPLFQGIDHIDMAVEDVEAVAAFYIGLGFEVARRTDHAGGAVELRFPGPGAQPVLELIPCVKPDGTRIANPGIRHIGLLCQDIGKAHAVLSARGVAFKNEPRFVPSTKRWLANTYDPSGAIVQLVGL
ncbi:VOC family protein [Variovorax terrae]|uniref:VOC family protein n=1 Tax=Variovorax terrae TaxID=2923278 RepID=A0A9X1VXR7_9BURK|nr:VOC family protein [Variovorax terrae]MCJ0765761.1 VOC family protein [Variovorax terrae]